MMPTVLVVDDEPSYGTLISQCANIRDMKAVFCEQSRDVKNILQQYPSIKLIFLDVSMPEPDGFEVLELLVKLGFDGWVVMMSGFDPTLLMASQEIASGYDLKLLPCLQKPFSIKSVDSVLVSYRDGRNLDS